MMKHTLIKIIIIPTFIILLLSGCSIVYINRESIDDIINKVLAVDSNLKTKSLEGYSYYLPQGVNIKRTNNLNSVLYYNHNKMYLYVDLISYYNKVENKYNENITSYYSKKIDTNNKSGYLEINEKDDDYYIEFMYNYSKIEAYTKKADLNKTLTTMAYILRSIKFQDNILDSLVGSAKLNFNEEQFNIYKSNGSNSDNFLDIIEQYDDGRMNSKDEDILEIEKNVE